LLKKHEHNIPIEVVERELINIGASLDDVYLHLVELMKNGEIGLIFEVRCPRCDDVLGTYCNVKEIPNNIYCYHCGYVFRKKKDLQFALRIIVADKKFFRRARSQMCP